MQNRAAIIYCKSCLDELGSCNEGWRKETTKKALNRSVKPSQASEVAVDDENQKQVSNTGNLTKLDSLNVEDFVAAKYDDRWYVGKILEINSDNGDALISFMDQRKNLFKWPRVSDELSVTEDDILCSVHPPEPTGKSKHMFKLSDDDRENVQSLFFASFRK